MPISDALECFFTSEFSIFLPLFSSPQPSPHFCSSHSFSVTNSFESQAPPQCEGIRPLGYYIFQADMNQELLDAIKRRKQKLGVDEPEAEKVEPVKPTATQGHNENFNQNKKMLEELFGGKKSDPQPSAPVVKEEIKGDQAGFQNARKLLEQQFGKGGGNTNVLNVNTGSSPGTLPPPPTNILNMPLPPPPMNLPPLPIPSLNLPPPPSLLNFPLPPPPTILAPPPSLNLPPPPPPLNIPQGKPINNLPPPPVINRLPPPPPINNLPPPLPVINLPPLPQINNLPPFNNLPPPPSPFNNLPPPPPSFNPNPQNKSIHINPNPQNMSIHINPNQGSSYRQPPPIVNPPPANIPQPPQPKPVDDEPCFILSGGSGKGSSNNPISVSGWDKDDLQKTKKKRIFQKKSQKKYPITQEFFGKNIGALVKQEFLRTVNILNVIDKEVKREVYDFHFPSIENKIRNIEGIETLYADTDNLDLVSCYMTKNLNAAKLHNEQRDQFVAQLHTYNWETDPQKWRAIRQSAAAIPNCKYTEPNFVQIKNSFKRIDNLINNLAQQQDFAKCSELKGLKVQTEKMLAAYLTHPTSNATLIERIDANIANMKNLQI